MNLTGKGLLLAVALGASLGACSDPAGPSYNPTVNNSTDDFMLQASGVAGVTHEEVYVWQNTGTRATVTHSTTTGTGLGRIVVMDAAGETVYDSGLQLSGTAQTTVGTAGAWRIELLLTGFSGTLNFRLQKL